MVGLTGEGSNFDGNGQFVRAQTGGGTYPVTLKGGTVDGGTLYGNSLGKPLGTKPAWTTKAPAVNLKADCYKQPVPDFAATPTGPSDAAG